MEMRHSLNLTQKQGLIMTQRPQQALKLLQVPTLELQQILKHEIMQNPLLEEVDEVTDQEDIDKEASADEQNNEESEDPAEEDPIDWTEYLQDGSLRVAGFLRSEGGDQCDDANDGLLIGVDRTHASSRSNQSGGSYAR